MWPNNDEESIPACVRIVPHRGRDEWVFPHKPPRTKFSTSQLDAVAPLTDVDREMMSKLEPPEDVQRRVNARIAAAHLFKIGGNDGEA